MEWYQILTIVGTNLVVFLGFFGAVITLHIHMSKQINLIQQEIKDFHGRLCAIEERNKEKK